MSFSIEYIVLFLLLIAFLFNPKSKTLLFIVVGYMIILGMMRGLYVGTDHSGYEADFYVIRNLRYASQVIQHRFEIGYIACIVFFKQFSNDYLTFSALAIPPTIIGIVLFIRKNNVPFAYGLLLVYLLGIYFNAYNIMRQVLAISIILAYINLLYTGKRIIFALITITFALLFHKSSVILLLLIPLFDYAKKIQTLPKRKCYILIIASLVMFFIGKSFLQGALLGITNILGMTEFDGYINNSEEDMGNTTSLFFTIYTLLLLYYSNSRTSNFELLVLVVFVVLFNIFQMMGHQSGRVAYPFLYYYVVAIPHVLQNLQGRNKILLLIVTILFCLGYFTNSFIVNNSCEVNPYVWRQF